MSNHNRKRKHRFHYYSSESSNVQNSPDSKVQFLGHHESSANAAAVESVTEQNPLRSLYIQAYEADVVRGPHAKAAAESLEVVEYRMIEGTEQPSLTTIPKIGSALIRLGGASEPRPLEDDDDAMPRAEEDNYTAAIWVDRYDARLLLDALPTVMSQQATAPPGSPTGWSDLPSDAEDTFFFTPDEAEDFHREKRRRIMELAREERLKARLAEDGDDEGEPNLVDEIWGGSDEEPDDSNKELMQRTAAHLLSSPNPAQLEMRILANHGADKRFAFLRGRWSRAWNIAKAKARVEKGKEVEKETSTVLGGLAGYGSDDSDAPSDRSRPDDNQDGGKHALAPDVKMDAAGKAEIDEEALKEARRKRLKEWKEKRQGKTC